LTTWSCSSIPITAALVAFGWISFQDLATNYVKIVDNIITILPAFDLAVPPGYKPPVIKCLTQPDNIHWWEQLDRNNRSLDTDGFVELLPKKSYSCTWLEAVQTAAGPLNFKTQFLVERQKKLKLEQRIYNKLGVDPVPLSYILISKFVLCCTSFLKLYSVTCLPSG
jgi:hypothetical protein